MRLNKLAFALGFVVLHVLPAFAGEILFVNMNNGKNEIVAAQKAAKENGDTLTIIPKEGSNYDHEEFKRIVREKSLKSLIISGHSGGDVFQGDMGSKVKIEDVLSALDDAKSSGIESLYLMGCYTANKSKIAFWKNALPNLKFIAGFEQEAPLSTKPAAQQYLYNLMKKEKSIVGSKNSQDLKLMLNGVNVLKLVNASLYISCQGEEYNYVSQYPNSKKLLPIDANDCAEKVGEFRKIYLKEVRKYLSAEAEPTLLNTQDSILRKAYSSARKTEYCNDEDTQNLIPELNADSLVFLLFNKGFNENFSRYYKDLIQKAIEDAELAQKNFDAYKSRANFESFETSNQIKDLLNRPDFNSMITGEVAQMTKEYEELSRKNPGLDDCAMWNRNCNFPNSLIQKYSGLWRLVGHLGKHEGKTPADIRKSIEELLNNNPIINEAPKISSDDIAIMKKMVSSPANVTRKDIVNLEKAFHKNENLSPVLSDFRDKIGYAFKLSPTFPFSWHEYSGGEIEKPGSRDAHFKNPALEIVNSTIFKDEYYIEDYDN